MPENRRESPKMLENRRSHKDTSREKRENGGTRSRRSSARSGINFKVGTKIEAMDYMKKWYPSKIVYVDEEESQVLIHFEGWNQRYDEWLPYDSERIRPVARASTRKDGLRGTTPMKFKAGDEVHARWTDCKFYPAKVVSVSENGTYEVYFFDGFKKTVQPINVRELPDHLKTEELFKDVPELETERPRSGTPRKRTASNDSNTDESVKEGEGRKRRTQTPTLFQTKKARLDQITGKLASKVSSTSSTKGSTTVSMSKSGRSEGTTTKHSKSDNSTKTSKGETKMAFKTKSDRLDQITGKLACKVSKAKQASVTEPPPALDYPKQPAQQGPYQDPKYHHPYHHLHNQQQLLLQHLHQEPMQGQKSHSVIASLLTQKPFTSSASGEGMTHPPPHHPPHHSLHLSPNSSYHMPHPPGMYGPLTSTGGMCYHSPPHSPYGSHYSMPATMSPTGSLPGYHHLSPTVVSPHLFSPSPHHMALDVGPPYFSMGMTGIHDTPPDTPQYQSALMRMLQATSQSAASTASSMGMTYPPISSTDGLLTTASAGTPTTATTTTNAMPTMTATSNTTVPTRTGNSTAPTRTGNSTAPTRTGRGAGRGASRSKSKKSMTASQLNLAAELALELAEGRIRTKDKAKVIAHKETTIAPKELVIDLDHKKFKCDAPGCNKAFRKQSGLEYHNKYYHSNKSKSRHLSGPSSTSSSKNRKRSSTSSLPSTRSSSCSSPSSPPSASITTDAVSTATAASTSSTSTLTATATDAVTIATTASTKTASGKSGHNRPSRIERKKRSSAPASLPSAHEQIIKSPVVMKPPETPEAIPEVKEEEKKPEVSSEQSPTPTLTTSSTPSGQDELKQEADVSIEIVDDPLSREEIVHCVCNMDEEDGFMIQCDTCLCWQHSTCVGLTESTVPKKYICCFCKNPAGHRTHSKYKYDQEWFKTGELAGYNCLSENYSKTMADSSLATHDLVGEMHVITDILNSLQCKFSILRTPNHPDLRKWLKPWNKDEEDCHDDSKANGNDSMESEDTKIDENSVSSLTSNVHTNDQTSKNDDVTVPTTNADTTGASKSDDVRGTQKCDDDTTSTNLENANESTKSDDVTNMSKSGDVTNTSKTDDVTNMSKSDDVTNMSKSDDNASNLSQDDSGLEKTVPVKNSENLDAKVDDISISEESTSKQNTKSDDVIIDANNSKISDVIKCKHDEQKSADGDHDNKDDQEKKDNSDRTESLKDDLCKSEALQSVTEKLETARTIKSELKPDNKSQNSDSGIDQRIQTGCEKQPNKDDSKNVEEVAMETEESKEEEDSEDMEVDVVNDDTTCDSSLKLSSTDRKDNLSLDGLIKDKKLEEHGKRDTNTKAQILNDKASDNDNEQGQGQGNDVDLEVKMDVCEVTGDEKKTDSAKDGTECEGTSLTKQSTIKKEAPESNQEQRQETSLKDVKDVKMSKEAVVQKEDVKNDNVKREPGTTGSDVQNKIVPSSVKLTGSSVWAQVGRAKGSNRKRTESLRSERSELSEIDVVEEMEPLPPYVCEWNLLHHVDEVQGKLDQRMDVIEQEVTALEATYGCPVTGSDVTDDILHIKRNMRRLLHDLSKIQELVR